MMDTLVEKQTDDETEAGLTLLFIRGLEVMVSLYHDGISTWK